MKTQLTAKTQMSVLAQTGANQVLTRIPTSEVATARRAVCGRLVRTDESCPALRAGEATLPKADLRLAQSWNGCHSTRPARRVWKQTLPALLGCILLSMPMAATAQDYDGFEFTTNAGGNSLTITAYTGSSNVVNIPNTIDGLSVTDIGTNAFAGTELTSVTIPTSVTEVGSGAFWYCEFLTNVTISLGVTDIGSNAFTGTELTSVTIPDSVTNIGGGAFIACYSLTNVTIGSGVISIGDYAFSWEVSPGGGFPGSWYPFGCPLSDITIPDSVRSIGDSAFAGCQGLTNVTIGTGVTSIGTNAFGDCDSLTAIIVATDNPAYSSVDGVLFNRRQNSLIQYPAGAAASYTIPNGVTCIGDYAFYDCSGITNVTIPDSVTYIGDGAFSGCSSLTDVTIPDGVTFIGEEAFQNCSGLGGVLFEGNLPMTDGGSLNGIVPPVLGSYFGLTVYYLPGRVGWSQSFGGCPTLLWNPTFQSLGVQSNLFGFEITGTTNIPIEVDTCTNLAGSDWILLQTCVLTNGFPQFSDPSWTNYLSRFYRIRFWSGPPPQFFPQSVPGWGPGGNPIALTTGGSPGRRIRRIHPIH